jgi:hypothetical protein
VARSSAFGSFRKTPGGFSACSNVARKALFALTGAALVVAAAGDAEAYVVKKTTQGDFVHWEERSVKYTIDPSVEAAVTNANDATVDAIGSWSGSVGAPDLETLAVDAQSPTAPAFDHHNGIFFMKGGYEPAGRALAITVLTYDNGTGKILDADVIFNGKYTFQVLSAPKPPTLADRETDTHISSTDGIAHDDASISQDTVYDLHHVIAHELGHSLGMNDELGRKDALMYRYSAPNDASIRSPAPDDIAGLAELYSPTLESHGSGCGSATVAPKKPTPGASHAAMFATLGFVLFLVLRAKSDRRARLGFVLAVASSAVALVPSLSPATGTARAATPSSVGRARAKVVGTSTKIENGLFKTSFKLATTACRASVCPNAGHGETWGGTVGNITQEVGGQYAPNSGDEVDVSFDSLPKPVLALASPLAGRVDPSKIDGIVRVLTRAE